MMRMTLITCQVLILTPLVVPEIVALLTNTFETSAPELSAPRLPILQNSPQSKP